MLKIICLLFCISLVAQNSETDSIPNNLDEVMIQRNRKSFTNADGNLKIDLDNSIYKAVPTAVDLLLKLPKVQISPDRETLTIIGKGAPLLYIDHQKVTINDVLSLFVDDIKNIELINNPSAKYEAEGRAVLLITKKFIKRERFELIGSNNLSVKRNINIYKGLSSVLRVKNTEMKIHFNHNDLNPWESNSNNYAIPDKVFASDYLVSGDTKRSQYVFGGSLTHNIDDEDYISLTVNQRLQDEGFDYFTDSNSTDNSESNQIATQGNTQGVHNFFNGQVNYNNAIVSKKANIYLGGQFTSLVKRADNFSENNYNQSVYNPFQSLQQDFNVKFASVRSDFEKEFENGVLVEFGALFNTAKATTSFRQRDFEKEQSSTSENILNESNTSIYSQVSGKYRKTSWSVGIRAENTRINSDPAGNASKNKYNYTRLFPKFELEIPLDSLTFTVNYARSISRPDYSSTNQEMTYINPYFAFANNINLKPSYTDEYSATIVKGNISGRLFYYHSQNSVNYGFLYDDTQELLIFRPENFDKEDGFGIEATMPFSYKKWESVNTISFLMNKLRDPSAEVGKATPYIYLNTMHNFQLSPTTKVSLTAWGLSNRNEGIFERRGIFILDIMASKTILKSLTMTFSANDIFRQMNFRDKFSISGIRTVANYYTDMREFSLSVKYVFGKAKPLPVGQKVTDDATRVK